MELFNYTAKNKNAEVIRDMIQAESRPDALSKLRMQGLTVVTLTSINPASHAGAPAPEHLPAAPPQKNAKKTTLRQKEKKSLFHHKSVKLKDLAMFCRQLAISINSGLPLRDALTGIYDDMDIPVFKKILGEILQKLHDGIAFSKAAAAYPRVFSSVFVGLIRSAEESGSMGETLTRLADYLESTNRLRRKIAGLMAYPIFVAVFFIGICLTMVFWIVPRFQEIFSGLRTDLPPLTNLVFSVNSALVNNAPAIGIGLFVIAVLFALYRRTKVGRRGMARAQLRMIWLGECIKQYVIARVCRCLAIMLKSGVPIATALQIVSKVSSNQIIEDSLIAARNQTIGGSNICDSLNNTKIFPSLLIRMVRVGESAGRLPEVLDSVASAYEDRVENTITTGVALLEPIIIIIFGAMILLLVISIYLPVMTVASHV